MPPTMSSSRAPRDPGNPLAVALIILGLLLAVAWFPRLGMGLGKHPLEGQAAPDFGLEVVHNGPASSKIRLSELQGKPVLLDFWATWCGPCRAIAPALEALATQYKGQVKVAKVDVDENNALAEQYGIQSIPTLLMFKGGKVVEQVVGAATKAKLEETIKKAL